MENPIKRYNDQVKAGLAYAEKERGMAPTSTFELTMRHFQDLGREIEEALQRECRDGWAFKLGQRVRKHSGSWWEGRVVGFYSTEQTPRGYCVQLEQPNGPVQIYPEKALELMEGEV